MRGALVVPGLGLAAALALLGGCAQATQPTGGPVPETPLRVLSVSPDTFEVREPFGGSLRVEFERRISERPTSGTLRDAVVVSPRTGEVEVSHRRRGIEISMEGGFRQETVYQITILPRLQDLWQNRMDEPFDFFFSTGPEFEPNLLAGLLVDRLTLQEVGDARVDARRLPDGPTHSTVADSSGIFAFQYLPAGRYRVTAWDDLNRSREPDFNEPQDVIEVEVVRGDTLILSELALLEPDTTAAVLTGASFLDSLSVEARFDDFLDPEESLAGVVATLSREDGEAPRVVEVLHRWEWDAREAARREAEAEAEAEPDPDEDPELEEVEEPEPPPADDSPILPGQELVLVLDGPLEPEVVYTVEVTGVTNINGIPGGGGETDFETPEPEPEPEEEPVDDGADGDPDGPPDGPPPVP